MNFGYQTIKLARLHESNANPRRHFDAAALEALAENLKTVGVRRSV